MTTTIPTMIIDDVELRYRSTGTRLQDPTECDHAWEPHLWDNGRAYCHQCGSFARWVNDPRLEEISP